MKKFLLITEILTHEYKDNGNRLMSFKLSAWTLGKNRLNFPHYHNSFVLIFIRDYHPFFEAILIETCADYKPFHAVSNTVETMKKFLLITEILTHEY